MVSGQQLCDLAESYVEALNKGGIPVIETAWEYMQSSELENAYRNTLEFHKKELNSRILPSLPSPEEKVIDNLKLLKTESLNNFTTHTLGDINNTKNQKYLQKLKAEFHLGKVQTKKKNTEIIIKACQNILDQLLSSVKQKLSQGSYPSLNDLQADLKNMQK